MRPTRGCLHGNPKHFRGAGSRGKETRQYAQGMRPGQQLTFFHGRVPWRHVISKVNRALGPARRNGGYFGLEHPVMELTKRDALQPELGVARQGSAEKVAELQFIQTPEGTIR
jgi:hypothetical protein